jgi:DNA repair protein RecO (recombination protein O)
MPTRQGRGRLESAALVWKRFDFRESSRVLALVLREHGRVGALAKGAHRSDSPLLGHIDFLNELRVVLSPDRSGLRVLRRAELVRERRGLREPLRFLAASHLAELCDPGFQPDRPDPELYDLLSGGLSLLERCPQKAIPAVVLGLELRYLQHLGALPDLHRCSHCGEELAGAFQSASGALSCRRHAEAPRVAVPAKALQALATLATLPGRELPHQDANALTPAAIDLPARWLLAALERRPRLRASVFRREVSA